MKRRGGERSETKRMKLLAIISQQSDTVFFWCDETYAPTFAAFGIQNGLPPVCAGARGREGARGKAKKRGRRAGV